MKFTLYDHAGKGLYLRQRLISAGHEETTVENIDEIDLVILDCDWPWAFPRPEIITAAIAHGAKVALYPHGGRPTCWVYDGIAEPDNRVDLRLEHGRGSVEMAATFNAGLRQEAPGWLFSPTADFKPVENPTRVLFAPLHPNIEMLLKGTNGHDPAPRLNQQIYRQLLELRDVEIVVSLAGPAWKTGVWPHPRARFTDNPHMLFHHSFEQILSADVVVAAGTMAAAAVALGKPTVMFDQDLFMDYVNGEYVQAEHQDSYRSMVRYPLDTADGPLRTMIDLACVGDGDVADWRQRWVGTDGTEKAIGLLEGLVGEEKATNDVVIQGATAQALTRS